MANRFRGEIAAPLGGSEHRLRLTMDGLAALQDALGASDLIELGRVLAERVCDPHVAAAVVSEGLRGAAGGGQAAAIPGHATPAELGGAGRALVEASFGKPAGPGSSRSGGRVRADISRAFTVAVRQAGIAPSQFWRLSLPEFVALFTAGAQIAERPDAAALGELAAMFPDRKPDRKE